MSWVLSSISIKSEFCTKRHITHDNLWFVSTINQFISMSGYEVLITFVFFILVLEIGNL